MSSLPLIAASFAYSPEEAINTFYYMKEVSALSIGRYLITDRTRISPTIRSLEDEPATASLLRLAVRYRRSSSWEAVCALSRQWASRCALLVALLRDREGNNTYLEWPLVIEFFYGTGSEPLQDYISTSIADEAVLIQASEVFVGSDHAKYSLVVFDHIAALVSRRLALRERGHCGSSLVLRHLGDREVRSAKVRSTEMAACVD
jgi:hypothetical protein